MLQYRTDLAMEAHELLCARSRAQTLSGVDSRTVFRRGCSVTSVRIDTEGAARQLGKPRGRYVTIDLSLLQKKRGRCDRARVARRGGGTQGAARRECEKRARRGTRQREYDAGRHRAEECGARARDAPPAAKRRVFRILLCQRADTGGFGPDGH